ncbi:MAG: MFS transporter [Euryarchaeota archaeon]|nr:MFS transporter [Euryarchaeota archaeon]
MPLKRGKFTRTAFLVFIFLSLVSLFADMTYEGARSMIGQYLEYIEAMAIIAGVVSVGELVSYFSRGLGGFIAGISKSSKVYWALVYVGYGINLIVVPLIGLFGRWEIVLALVMIERFGKGLRAPARDVILSEVTKNIGRGKAFGFHELMDQLGAVLGPLIASYALYVRGYAQAFLVLAIPAVMSLIMLFSANRLYPKIESIELEKKEKDLKILPDVFWYFTFATVFMSLGFVSWFFLSYYFRAEAFPDYVIPLMYSIAMLADGIVAFPVGLLYDRIGVKVLIVTPILIVTVLPLVLSGEFFWILMGVVIWGIVMGFYETVMRAFIADVINPKMRSYAYGIYGVLYGVSWTVGNVIIAFFYQYGILNLALIYVTIVEIISLGILVKIALSLQG